MIKYTSRYGSYNLYLEIDEYAVGGKAITMRCENGEPFGRMTVCIEPLVGDIVYLDTNNIPGIESLVEKYKLGAPTGKLKMSGFCVYPQYKLNIENIKKHRR